MTDLEKRFFELATESERLKKDLKKTSEEMDKVMAQLGLDSYLQDPMTGLVYKIVEPDGTFVTFHKIGYKRTAKVEERQGTLSKKEAEEAGFILLSK